MDLVFVINLCVYGDGFVFLVKVWGWFREGNILLKILGRDEPSRAEFEIWLVCCRIEREF